MDSFLEQEKSVNEIKAINTKRKDLFIVMNLQLVGKEGIYRTRTVG